MIKEKKPLTLFSLFIECFFISLVTFGGGSTIIALLQKKFVEKLKWIDESEMLEMVVLAQTSPGATSVNTLMLVGYRLFELKGAVICAIASALPPLLIISIITLFYKQICESVIAGNALRGVRACAAALLASVSLGLAINLCKKKDFFNIIVLLSAIVAATIFRVNALIIVSAGLVLGIFRFFFFAKSEKEVKRENN